jgi:hypothetical protein
MHATFLGFTGRGYLTLPEAGMMFWMGMLDESKQ